MLSVLSTFRYGYWRVTQVVRFFHDPAGHPGALYAFFIFYVPVAEACACVILFLGSTQTSEAPYPASSVPCNLMGFVPPNVRIVNMK
jgi:hypothetical protein